MPVEQDSEGGFRRAGRKRRRCSARPVWFRFQLVEAGALAEEACSHAAYISARWCSCCTYTVGFLMTSPVRAAVGRFVPWPRCPGSAGRFAVASSSGGCRRGQLQRDHEGRHLFQRDP